ncbi:SpoIIE family protein phosphatase [Alkalihalobacillus sp. MEB130]|uniref:SpoIIE family protein phosphatase n=1 Tax=Alkalihalobacillus sp. MEB130 TaxID=2976704 RepID=UPI0028DF20C5|nr:SpoIIE family protein phosphatase [Alkalihalobacillus sp. MEB130]MDT8862718.1 SpoIIE family protein phosphatase [Alkalihalobacillus sp. MEB130]
MLTIYKDEKVELAAYERAKKGNDCNGDTHVVIQQEHYLVCAVIDGLGSGAGALKSASAAIDVIRLHHDQSVQEMVVRCNEALRNKRGAVLTVLKVDYDKRVIRYCNFGNISFVMYLSDGQVIQPIPTRGYLSGRKQVLTEKQFPYLKGSFFLLHSDGVRKKPDKELFKTLTSPKEAADVLFSSECFADDDVTMIVGKLP